MVAADKESKSGRLEIMEQYQHLSPERVNSVSDIWERVATSCDAEDIRQAYMDTARMAAYALAVANEHMMEGVKRLVRHLDSVKLGPA